MKHAIAGILLIVIAASGCAKGGDVFAPLHVVLPSKAIVADTPAHAIELLNATYVAKDPTTYAGLFTEDYAFLFCAREALVYPPVNRDDELNIATNMFVRGNGSEPAMGRIDLELLGLTATPDQRPGKLYPYHVQIATNVNLKADLGDMIWNIQGDQIFYLVRGDSAQVPPGLPADSTHWYIEAWQDYSDGGGPGPVMQRGAGTRPADTMPTARHTWGQLKSIYR